MLPYTYVITHLPSGQRYYGSRYSRGCHPSDLWVSYFSSSRKIKQLLKEDGPGAFKAVVRRTFVTKDEALRWECTVLRRLRVMTNDAWINQHHNGAKFRAPDEVSVETRRKLSRANKGRPKSEEHKQRIREASLRDRERRRAEGWRMPHEALERMRAAHIGTKRPPEAVERMRASKVGTVRVYQPDGSYKYVKP